VNRKGFIGLCIFIIVILFFFPKDAGRGGNVPISEVSHCSCFGFSRIINVQQTNVFKEVCYGIVTDCENYIDCKGDTCWHKDSGCKCPGTEFWTESKGSCQATDAMKNCVCTHDECEGLQAIGG